MSDDESSPSEPEASAHYDRGIANRESGRLEEAITEFTLAMRSRRYLANGYLMIGLCQVELGREDEAAASFRAGLSVGGLLKHERVPLLYELGDSYLRVGDRQSALECFRRVFSENPEYRDVRERVGRNRKRN